MMGVQPNWSIMIIWVTIRFLLLFIPSPNSAARIFLRSHPGKTLRKCCSTTIWCVSHCPKNIVSYSFLNARLCCSWHKIQNYLHDSDSFFFKMCVLRKERELSRQTKKIKHLNVCLKDAIWILQYYIFPLCSTFTFFDLCFSKTYSFYL